MWRKRREQALAICHVIDMHLVHQDTTTTTTTTTRVFQKRAPLKVTSSRRVFSTSRSTGPNVPSLPQAPLSVGTVRRMVLHPSIGETEMEACPKENRQGGKTSSVHGHAEGQISAHKVIILDLTSGSRLSLITLRPPSTIPNFAPFFRLPLITSFLPSCTILEANLFVACTGKRVWFAVLESPLMSTAVFIISTGVTASIVSLLSPLYG